MTQTPWQKRRIAEDCSLTSVSLDYEDQSLLLRPERQKRSSSSILPIAKIGSRIVAIATIFAGITSLFSQYFTEKALLILISMAIHYRPMLALLMICIGFSLLLGTIKQNR